MGKLRVVSGDSSSFTAYRADPSDKLAKSGMLVIQEIFGLTPFVKGAADHLANEGHAATAPDLFWRAAANIVLDPGKEEDRARAMQLNESLDQDLAIADCNATVRALREELGEGARVGAVGYCLGGRLAYLLATRTDIDAAVGYYGVAIDAWLGEAARIRKPLLLHIAGDDHLCPPPVQRMIIETLRDHAPLAEVHVYEGAGHGFARANTPAYNAEAAELADRRTVAFLARHITG